MLRPWQVAIVSNFRGQEKIHRILNCIFAIVANHFFYRPFGQKPGMPRNARNACIRKGEGIRYPDVSSGF